MEKERELPELMIRSRIWLADLEGFQIVDKENPKNRISVLDMQYSEDGYRFAYSKSSQTLAKAYHQQPDDVLYVNLFHFTEMNPSGVAKKYGLSVDEVIGKTDYEVMIDKQLCLERLKGNLPTVDIAGDVYYLDASAERFYQKKNAVHREIPLSDILDFYNQKSQRYEIPYNYRTGKIEVIDRDRIVEHPPGVSIVAIPQPAEMDPIGYAEAYGFNKAEILDRIPQKMHFTGEILNSRLSWLNRLIEKNRSRFGLSSAVKKNEQPAKRKRVKVG